MQENHPETKQDFKYWAFISYSHRDEEFCGWLHTELETYKTPSSLVGKESKDGSYAIPEKLYPIFRDREELPAGANLSDAITAALNTSRYLVVICSAASAQSPWVNKEIEYFSSLGREKYILPIILNGEPNSKNGKDPECFPPVLREPKEPLAADARDGKDGKEAALMKLRAGLLGVGLEDLVQRELHRQKRELEEETSRRREVEHYYGLVLAEKADRAFTQLNVNEGKIYAAHALARIDERKDKDAEITRSLTLGGYLGNLGIPVVAEPAVDDNLSKDEVFSPDGKICALRDKEFIHLLDTATGQSIFTLRGHMNSVLILSFSPDGEILASGSLDETVRLWDVATGKPITTFNGHENLVHSVTFSSDGKILASGGWDKTVRLWDIAKGKSIATLNGHEDSVESITFAQNGKMLASGSRDKAVRLWDVAKGKPIATLNGHTKSVCSVTFLPDGKTLASRSDDKTVRLWSFSNGNANFSIEQEERDKTISPDGKIRASRDVKDPKIICLLDATTDKSIATFNGHENLVSSITFSSDGKMLASGSWDTTVRLWNVSTGQCIATLNGCTDWVYSVTFSSDGKMLASGNFDKTVRLWDVASGKPIATLKGHESSVWSVNFSPDGKTLVSKDRSGNVKQWLLNDLSIRDWAAQAAEDEKCYGFKLQGLKLVPIDSDGGKKP